jgi:hypothetical protein
LRASCYSHGQFVLLNFHAMVMPGSPIFALRRGSTAVKSLESNARLFRQFYSLNYAS